MSESPFETWKYEKQTKMKHLVFADYFDKWVKILSKDHNINFIDGFGGIGAYTDPDKGNKIEYGSPIIACRIIFYNFKKLNRDLNKCDILIIDNLQKNLKNIEKILKYLKLNLNVSFAKEDFDKKINEVLDSYKNIAPTFFLIDPFGFKIKLETLKRIMEIPKSEILLNFMYSGIIRNLTVPDAEKILNDLFGCEDWKKYIKLSPKEKEENLFKLYRKQLKTFSTFVTSYRFSFPEIDRTYYYLFHLTKHYLGCSIMKSSFAAHNLGRNEYLGAAGVQKTLLEVEPIKIDLINNLLLEHFKCRRLSYLNILEEILDEFDYTEPDFYHSLKNLENKGKIKIIRNPPLTKTGKNRTSLEPDDIIEFK